MKRVETENRLCGNCSSHNPYEYPDKIFCSARYAESKNPIVDTLWSCEMWTPATQKCYCIREILERNKRE